MAGILSLEVWRRLTQETIEIRKVLWGLRRRVLEDPDRKKKPKRRKPNERSTPPDGIDEPTDKTDQTDEAAD